MLFGDREPAVVTCPQPFPSSYAGKAAWLQEHGWKIPGNAFLCSQKSDLANSRRVLIDDDARNCMAWSEAGGQAILFPTPANELHQIALGGDVMGFVRCELERISGRRYGRKPAIRKPARKAS